MRRIVSPPLIHRFASATRASSAVEFAIIFPTLLFLMLMGTQLILYINATRKVEQLAASMSEMISQASPPNVSTTIATVSSQDLHFAYDAGLVVFPYLMKDAVTQNLSWWQDINIDFASIQFTAIPNSNCSGKPDLSSCYLPKVVWTSSGTTGSNYRPCTIPLQLPASNTAQPTNTTLPAGIFGPNSVVVVDVVFTFHPTFGTNLIGPIKITRSTYTQPRYASLINYSLSNNDGIAVVCP